MSDIISAKCFGCGHVVKVPSALGGKKARCPQCTNTIVIPTGAESNAELVSDADLPEVARDEDMLKPPDADPILDPVVEPEPEPEEGEPSGVHTRTRTRTRARGGRRAGGGGGGGGGRRGGFTTTRRRKSNTGLVVGIVIAVLAVIGIAVGVSMGGGSGNSGTGRTGQTPEDGGGREEAPPPPAQDPELEARALAYAQAVNGADPGRIRDYYRVSDDQQRDLLQAVQRMVGQNVRYENAVVKSADGQTGQVVMEYAGGQVSQTWEKSDGKWYLTTLP